MHVDPFLDLASRKRLLPPPPPFFQYQKATLNQLLNLPLFSNTLHLLPLPSPIWTVPHRCKVKRSHSTICCSFAIIHYQRSRRHFVSTMQKYSITRPAFKILTPVIVQNKYKKSKFSRTIMVLVYIIMLFHVFILPSRSVMFCCVSFVGCILCYWLNLQNN